MHSDWLPDDASLPDRDARLRSARGATTTSNIGRSTSITLAMLTLMLAAGCSGDTSPPGAGGTGGAGGAGLDATPDDFVRCAEPQDPVDTYLPNMKKRGSNGVLTFTLVESDHAPPIRNRNTWLLKIVHADQTSAGVVVPEVTMPRHPHPPGEQPEVSYNADLGLYTAKDLYFSMPGYWSSQFTAYEGAPSDGVILDRAAFYFCID